MGIEFEWDEAQDSYFTSCRDCRSKHGVCGFDPSDPGKRFVCFRSRSRFSPPWIGGDDPKRFAILCSAFALACLLLFSLIGVAIYRSKRFNWSSNSSKSFCNEILILSSIDHQNLVKLHGYCSDPRGLVLVYDYVPNETLAHHLHGLKPSYGREPLSWRVRVEIALQTAMAMEYLHFAVVPPIVHRDITSSNIFVEKDMRIKVGDFGLSRLLVLAENSSNPNPNSNPQTGFSSAVCWTEFGLSLKFFHGVCFS